MGPRIQFATAVYDFGRAKAGELVKYSFVFTNTGDEVLQLTAVQPSCGCTTAGDWTRQVKPGETGNVAIQFNSAAFNGPVFKTVSVSANDKQHPVTVLQLKGTIWKPIELIPPYTVINVAPDVASASASIRIINHTDEPLVLSVPEWTNRSFAVTLTTNQPGTEFQLTIASVGPLTAGNVQSKISLKTSFTNIPNLDVPFWMNVQPAVAVTPHQITLQQTPLAANAPTTITIQNNSTNALSLTEPAVNAPGVDVQIKELSPGKVFTALVTFPEGFQMPAGQPVALTMKSNNPQLPEIRVPVVQSPRSIVAPPQAPKPQPPVTGGAANTAANAPAIR